VAPGGQPAGVFFGHGAGFTAKVFGRYLMDVMIIATKACSHRQNLEKELECLHIPYRVCFVEDHADLVEKFSIRHSPNLIVDDEVVFRKQPTEVELHAFFLHKNINRTRGAS
jgi:hypothetical protein